MDSSCTYHMYLEKKLFETLVLKEEDVVFLGNNKVCKCKACGQSD